MDLVHLGVTVVGKDGQLVSGLTAEDFVIHEEGREQGIAYFSRGLDGDLETMPFHLGVLFDTSGSMNRDVRVRENRRHQVPRGSGPSRWT